jgi:hypothetical protein
MTRDTIVAFTESDVRKLAGITQRQLRYWADHLAPPAVAGQI